MSRSKKVTIIVMIIALVIGGLLLFLEFGEQTTEPEGPPAQDEPVFPFATTTEFFADEDDDGISTTTLTDDDEDLPALWKVSDDPVAGSRWINQSVSNQDTIRFVKQENGHLYAANPNTRNLTQLTDVTVPQVKEALIAPSGRTIVLRYLDDTNTIQTYNANLKEAESTTSVPYTLEGSFLAPDIYEITMSPDGSQLFYLQETNDRSVGVLHNIETDERSQIFISEVSRWRAQFSQSGSVTIFTPPADGVTGYAYRINTETGRQKKITDATGLTVKENPDGSAYLRTSQTDKRFAITPINTSEEFSVNTFSEKCFWESTNIVFCGVPEDQTPRSITSWYQGQTNFVDDLYLFNTETGSRDQLLSDDQINRSSADMVELDINESFTELIFTDRTSGDLWGFEL
jgi:hypothetical protein